MGVALLFSLFLIALTGNCNGKFAKQSARFFYEIEFEMFGINYDFNHIIKPAQSILDQVHTMISSNPFHLNEQTIQARGAILAEIKYEASSLIEDTMDLTSFVEEDVRGARFLREIPNSTRITRSAEWLGQVWHDLSGSPGPWEYKKELEMFSLIRTALRDHAKLSANNQKEIALLQSALEREQVEIEVVTNTTNKIIDKVQSTISNEIYLSALLTFRSHTMPVLSGLRVRLSKITSVMEQAKLGMPSINLVDHAEFRRQIRKIKQKHRILSPVFDENEVHLYYSIPIVKMIWTGTLDIYVRIPLVNHGKTYEISPINKASTSQSLAREDYILTARDGKSFPFLTDAELQKCLKVHSSFISDLRVVESDLHTLNCTNLGCSGRNSNGIIEIRELTTESFAYSTSDPFEASLVCDSGHHPVKLPARGFLTLPTDCALTCNLFSIDRYPQNFDTKSNINGIGTFSVEKIPEVEKPEPISSVDISEMKSGVEHSLSQLDQLREESIRIQGHFNATLADLSNTIAYAYYYQYGAAGGVGITFLILIFVLSCCFWQVCKKLGKKMNA